MSSSVPLLVGKRISVKKVITFLHTEQSPVYLSHLQEGNTPQGSSHGVKISEPQKKTSFFRCSLLWGPRPSISAVSWLDINGLCLLLALPSPSLFLPTHGLSSQSTQTIIFPVSGGLPLLPSSSERFQWCISSILRRSVVFIDQSAWLVELCRCSLLHKRQALTFDVAMYYALIFHTASSTNEDEK